MMNFLTIPFTFVANTIAKATEINANIQAIVSKISEIVAYLNSAPTAVAEPWTSGNQYSKGAVAWSPITFLTYRAKADMVNSTTDPSTDSTNWQADNLFPLGVQFGNVAASGNTTLDWYERNIVLDPTVAGNTVAGAGTYTTKVGRASRLGTRVRGSMTLAWNAHTGTGIMKVMGLPFVAANVTGLYFAVSVEQSGLVVGSGKQLSATIAPSTNYIVLTADDPAGGASSGIPMDTAVAQLVVTFEYEAA